ncbi:MAG: 30S ribosomal protein S20 [Opitutales bacterium]
MANKKATRKHMRATRTRELRNRDAKTRLKTLGKKVSEAAHSGDDEALEAARKNYVSALDKAGKTGLIHKNKVNRQKARCSRTAVAA